MSFPSLFALLFAGAPLRRRRALPRWLPALALVLAGMLGSSMAQATVYTFNGAPVTSCTLSGKVYTCPYPAYLDWDDSVVIGNNYTLKVTNSVTVTYNQGLTMGNNAKLIVTGNLNLTGVNPANLKTNGGDIEVGGTFSMGALAQSMTADVTAGAIRLGSDRVTIIGNLVSQGMVDISSGSKITGDISGTVVTTGSPVTISGKVTATSKFMLASGSTMTGDITAPMFDMLASGSKVTGNILATTSMVMGSGNAVKGDVDTGNLTLQSSSSIITGNARVNWATLEWAGRVTGTIYCKNGTAKDKCDCVTNNSGFAVNTANGPRCEGAAPKAPHHYLVTHDGEGDTCLPEKITVTACANATCTAPHYAGAVSGKLAGVDTPFSIAANAGSVQVSATRFAEGVVTLGVSDALAAQDATTCYRSSSNTNSCAMSFAGGAKLLVEVPNHAAGADIKALIRAVKANDTQTACVAAFENLTYNVQYSCNYSRPKAGSLPLALGDKSLSCAASTATAAAQSVSTEFKAKGVAELALKYADAGEVRLNASVTPFPGMTAKGEGTFVAAPASFKLAAAAGPHRAGADVGVTVTALNSAGVKTPNFDTGDMKTAGVTNHDVALDVACRAQGGEDGVFASAASFVDGEAAATARWSEVGKIELKASLAKFMGTELGTTGLTYDPSKGCLGSVGPFIPQYFKVEIDRPPAQAARSFQYSQEPFEVIVTARNKGGDITRNYSADVKDKAGAGYSEKLLVSAVNAAGAAFAPAPGVFNAVPGVQPALVEIAADKFMAGSAKVKVAYALAAPNGPQAIRLRAANGKAAPADVTSAYTATPDPDAAKEATTSVRTGRLRVGGRFGVLKATLSVPVTAEYWTGKSWLLHSDDNYTILPEVAWAFKPYPADMKTDRKFKGPLVNGATAVDLKVSSGGPGKVDIALNLGSTAQDDACIGDTTGTGVASTGAALPWLRPVVTGCAATTSRDPAGRATFGVFTPENRRVIHVREVFN
ncbi:polymer-forming cytoskeletal protein [Massilia yuzhufengensis]|uniref:MSHA biogenesis protein MshQ n=1 Tax=Massilia yuzhufengensis TaxID=1164594 RepID=A0A1I1LIH1_9BURK|nr:polymer-forming cytoskeletal protein [Massilia yuzhufengensis]SFC72746.1 MSHA biogenesis protein MshQ [Massilia yuzhufengensis]